MNVATYSIKVMRLLFTRVNRIINVKTMNTQQQIIVKGK